MGEAHGTLQIRVQRALLDGRFLRTAEIQVYYCVVSGSLVVTNFSTSVSWVKVSIRGNSPSCQFKAHQHWFLGLITKERARWREGTLPLSLVEKTTGWNYLGRHPGSGEGV